MARLKKGEKKRTQITIRIDPEIADKLKSIDKYSSKVGDFIDAGIEDYFNWLNEKSEKVDNCNENNKDLDNSKLFSLIVSYYDDIDNRNNKINKLKQNILDIDSSRYYKFHPDIAQREKKNYKEELYIFENWDEYKLSLIKNFNIKDINKKKN